MATTDDTVERAVRERYSEAAQQRVEALCCPTSYDPALLEVIPAEVLERDYGCGDPSRHVRRGETVLDLGSGAGKICYIASQVVGPEGRVIGVDMNDEMLELAESHRRAIGERIGHHNVEFKKARIQDLAIDIRALEARLAERPVGDAAGLEALEGWIAERRLSEPLIAADSIDVIVSNCVLNLVRPTEKARLFDEMARVLRPGGRAVISDIVCEQDVPASMQADPELWSGCISGAYREEAFIEAFERAGFHGMRILERDPAPWRVVDGLEFRSMTVEAFAGGSGAGFERGQAVIYRGPWRRVIDDNGRTLERGARTEVSDSAYERYGSEPYRDSVVGVTTGASKGGPSAADAGGCCGSADV